MSDLLELGWISGVFGVRGEVKVHLHNPDSDWLTKPREVALEDDAGARRTVRLTLRRGAGKRWLGRVEGLEDRDEAAAMQGLRILVDPGVLPKPKSGEFYVHAVEGLPVRVGDAVIGTLEQVHATDHVDIFEIVGEDEVWFVPCISENIVSIDPANGEVVLTEAAIAAD